LKLIHIIFVGLAGWIGLAGCNGSEPETAEPETVFDPMVEALEKAEAVQDLDLERKRRIDAELEQN
jgi:hypothetical protein